jgi:hypothetical protein
MEWLLGGRRRDAFIPEAGGRTKLTFPISMRIDGWAGAASFFGSFASDPTAGCSAVCICTGFAGLSPISTGCFDALENSWASI